MDSTAKAMKAIAKNKTFLPLGILHSFAEGRSIETTIKRLLKEHERCPTLVPRVDKDEVEFWYNSFNNGNFDLSQDATTTQLSKLERLPVLEDVIHLTNAADQKALRQVCKSFRSCIDGNKRLYDNIEIVLTSQGISVQSSCVNTKKNIKKIFVKRDVGCAVNTNGKHSTSENDYFTAAFAEFKQTLEKNHTKVQKFVVKYTGKKIKEVDRVRFLSDIATVLSNLKQKLDVEKVELMVQYPEELDAILKSLKPENLKKLLVLDDDSMEWDFKISIVTSFFLHLQHLEFLALPTRRIDVGINTFVETPVVFLSDIMITPLELLRHTKKLLKLSSFRHLKFSIDMPNVAAWIAENEKALESLTPCYNTFNDENFNVDEDHVSGTIPFQDGSKDVLFFSIGKTCLFKRKKGDKCSE